MEEIKKILSELRPDVDFSKEANLIDDEILDSFDIISLVGELNEVFGVEIGMEHLLPENFNSMEKMFELIESLKNQ